MTENFIFANIDSIYHIQLDPSINKIRVVSKEIIFERIKSKRDLSYKDVRTLLNEEAKKFAEKNKIGKYVFLNETAEDNKAIINSVLAEVYQDTFNGESKQVLQKVVAGELKKYEPDKVIIHYVENLEQLTKVWNILLKRIREFLYIKSPELVLLIEDDNRLVEELKNKDAKQILKENNKASYLTVDLPKEDEMELKELVKLADSVNDKIKTTKERLIEKIKALMPKTSEVATPLIAAKLLTIAGSFEKLAMMPSSRVQLLGAEKALFRYLKSGNKMPKYGVLFQHPDVLNAEKKNRGKTARKLAAKISIALKQDYFGMNKNEQ